MSSSKKNILIIFELISYILVIISYLLYIIQSFINNHFIKSNSKSVLTERLLYEKFSEEIYNNIRSYPINKIQNKTSNKLSSLILSTKLDTFYDCEGVFNGLLNEDICQNKIVNNLTCCKSECCSKDKTGKTMCNNYNFNIKKTSLSKNTLTYNNDEVYDDPKRRYCKYFNEFSGNITRVLKYDLQFEKFNYTYENILLNKDDINTFIKIDKKDNNNKDFVDCGEIDSLKNHLFVKGISCPINYVSLDIDNNILFFDSITQSSLGIFVKNYLSEIPPLIHEWTEIFKSREISIKDIDELIIKKNNDFNNYYKKQDAYFYINQIPNLRNYASKINPNQKIFWYSTNYIGFESEKDLKKFKSIFNENDMNDNPLYKIRESITPAVGTIVVGIILLITYFIFFINFLREIKKNLFLKMNWFKVKEIITFVSLLAYFIIYLFMAHGSFKKININMDVNYKEIFNLYNSRRRQNCFLAGIILHFIACGYEVYYFLSSDGKKEVKDFYEVKKGEKNESTIVHNNLSNTAEDIDKNVEIMQNSAERMKDSLKFSIKDDKQKINVIKFQP